MGMGSLLSIARVGNTAPQIIHVLTSGEIKQISCCPSCGASLLETELNYICENQKCPKQIQEKLIYFFQKIDLKGMGAAVLKNIPVLSLLDTLRFLYINKEWVTGKSEYKLKELLQSLRPSKKQIMAALGIKGISDAYIAQLEEDLTLKEKTKHTNKDIFFLKYQEENMPLVEDIYNLFHNVS